MSLVPDFNNLIIHSDASITDMVAFHADLREIESSDTGMLYPAIHTYKEVPLGGGGIFPAVSFINGWTLQFPAGNWTVTGGNLAAIINPVANCYVLQTQSAAFAVTSALGGTAAPTASEVSAAVWGRLIESGYTADDLLKLMAAALAGKVSGADGNTIVFRDLADTRNRISATVDPSGNRTAVVYDVQ